MSPTPQEPPLEWVVTAHGGAALAPPYRLRLEATDLAEAVEHDAGIIGEWWPGGDPEARAYEGGPARRLTRRGGQKALRSRSASGRPSGSTSSR